MADDTVRSSRVAAIAPNQEGRPAEQLRSELLRARAGAWGRRHEQSADGGGDRRLAQDYERLGRAASGVCRCRRVGLGLVARMVESVGQINLTRPGFNATAYAFIMKQRFRDDYGDAAASEPADKNGASAEQAEAPKDPGQDHRAALEKRYTGGLRRSKAVGQRNPMAKPAVTDELANAFVQLINRWGPDTRSDRGWQVIDQGNRVSKVDETSRPSCPFRDRWCHNARNGRAIHWNAAEPRKIGRTPWQSLKRPIGPSLWRSLRPRAGPAWQRKPPSPWRGRGNFRQFFISRPRSKVRPRRNIPGLVEAASRCLHRLNCPGSAGNHRQRAEQPHRHSNCPRGDARHGSMSSSAGIKSGYGHDVRQHCPS